MKGSHGTLDTLSRAARSVRMGQIRSSNTKPEIRVRRVVHALGYRYRLHARELPGTPDIVFRPVRKAIFVHGCFWHRHFGCRRNRLPKSPERRDYWKAKLDGNVERDRRNRRMLVRNGWSVLVIWECESEDEKLVRRKVQRFLD